jgi:CheY-like chemotaxis protein
MEDETSLRILLAEDDGEMRRLLALVLRRDGHQVVEARDGGELLEALAWTLIEPGREDFDLVICEQSLPGVPGLTVLEGLRARDRTTPFILITRNPGLAARARRLNAFVLDRPFDVRAIRSAIRESADTMRPTND